MEVERVSEDGLSREVWRFTVGIRISSTTVNLVVGFYGRETRASKRHKFVSNPATRFDFYDMRRYNSGINADDVPLPDDVAAEAAAKINVVVHPANANRGGLF